MNNKLCKIVKQACLRSLSVEISTPLYVETSSSSLNYCSIEYNYYFIHIKFLAKSHSSFQSKKNYSSTEDSSVKNFTIQSEKDGVVLFGDEENGYTLSHTFKYFFIISI